MVVGKLGFLSNYVAYLWEPLVLCKGNQDSFRVLRGHLGLHLRGAEGPGPHLVLRVNLLVFELHWNVRFLSLPQGLVYLQEVKDPFELRGAMLDCSVTAERIGPHLRIERQFGGISRVAAYQTLCSFELQRTSRNLYPPQGLQLCSEAVRGNTRLLLRHCRAIGPHLALKGNLAVSRVSVGS